MILIEFRSKKYCLAAASYLKCVGVEYKFHNYITLQFSHKEEYDRLINNFGPVKITSPEITCYFEDGVYHRLNGPAYVWFRDKYYYIKGVKYNNRKDFLKARTELKSKS